MYETGKEACIRDRATLCITSNGYNDRVEPHHVQTRAGVECGDTVDTKYVTVLESRNDVNFNNTMDAEEPTTVRHMGLNPHKNKQGNS